MQTRDEVWRDQLNLWNNSTCLVQCLGNKSTVMMIQNNSQQFSQMVLKKPSIAKQLLQMALIPEHYQLRYCQLSLDNTYNCMEVLGCLSADFTLHCTRDLLPWMLEMDIAEGTPLSNLLRILTTLLYHHPTEFIHCLADRHPQFMHTHLSDGGVVDFVLRVMEVEDEASFYSQQKVTILQRIVHTIGQTSEQFLPDVLEAYAGILVGLAQKGDDRFDGSKFNDFFKMAFSTPEITDFILPLYQEYRDRELATECIQVIEAYLRFIAPDSSDSLLPQQFLHDVAAVLSSKVPNRHTCLFMVFYLQSLSRVVKLDGVSLKAIITQPLLNSIMQLMPMYPSNTIIHNLVKDILISVLNKNPHYFGLMMVQEGSVLLGMLQKVTGKNSIAPMENALYHVYNSIMLTSHTPILEVLKKSCYEEMVENLQQKKAFYETKIGGNPRADSDKLGSSDEFVIGGAGLEILNAWSVKQTYSDDGNKSEGEDLPLSSNQPNQLEDLQLKVDSEHSFDLKLNSVEPNSCAQQEEINKQEGSFMKHFGSYVHFDVDQLMSQMN